MGDLKKSLATVTGLVAWLLVASAFVAALACLRVPGVLHSFDGMYPSLHKAAPTVIGLIWAIPDMVWEIAPICLSFVILTFEIAAKDNQIRLKLAAFTVPVIWAIYCAPFFSILWAVTRLQQGIA